jgi:YihY family inner membrane protein
MPDLALKLKPVGRTLSLAFKKFVAIDGTQRAAAFAYYAFFSLFPLLVLFVTIGSLFVERTVAIDQVLGYLEKYVPLDSGLEDLVFDTIGGVVAARGEVSGVAVLALLWGGLQFFKALVRATNRAWNSDMHNWWQMPLKSMALVGVLGSALVLGLVVPVAVKLLNERLAFAPGAVHVLGLLATAAVPPLVLFYGLALFYRVAPRRRTRFAEVWVAALGVAVLLRLLGAAFAFYISNFARFNVVYGTFGGIMALLMWIYVSGCLVVFGACLVAAQAEVRAKSVGREGV